MKVHKVTTVLIVSDMQVESKFWQALGFITVAEVPHGEAIGFSILTSGDSEIMLQTIESVRDDIPAVAEALGDRKSYQFAHVENLGEAMRATAEARTLVPERKTFYGTKEIFVQSQSGEVIGLAQKLPAGADKMYN